MRTRPFRLFSEPERARLLARVEERCAVWARDWLPAGVPWRVETAPPEAREDWLAWGSEREWWALACADGELAAAICGGCESPLALGAAHTAIEALGATLLGAEAAPSFPATFDAGPGAAHTHVVLTAGTTRLHLASSASWTLRQLQARPAAAALTGRRTALAGRGVDLRVILGVAEVDLVALRGLQIGDVITLDARIDQPLEVQAGDGALCEARLGAQDGCRAVSLMSSF
jgi:flagellar motor switch/type III secretory pathway protein FliN